MRDLAYDLLVRLFHSYLPYRFGGEIRNLISEYSESKSNLEGSLKAARREADCLREQLRLADKASSNSTSRQAKSNLCWREELKNLHKNGNAAKKNHADPSDSSSSADTARHQSLGALSKVLIDSLPSIDPLIIDCFLTTAQAGKKGSRTSLRRPFQATAEITQPPGSASRPVLRLWGGDGI